ncbi:MAG: NAD(P)-dependent oxidoreductase [Desulfobacterales bacterium]|nr:MAG: NAD(P)-dependent oxidoreductase [Desulfobacterales bacterium]
MKALVTGAAGFIGSNLIPALLEKGFEIVAFDMAREAPALESVSDRITYIQGDLGSTADLYRIMAAEKITDVFHLGALLAGPCEDNPLHGFKVNFESTHVLLDAAAALNINRFVMLSSIAVFGKDAPEPVLDDAVKNPETIYGQTKLACEHLLLWYGRRRGVDGRALRLTWVYGPGRTTGITALYSSLILDAFALDKPMHIPNPDERGDWLYIKDAVAAIWALWQAESLSQRIYNIAGGVHAIRDVVEIARKIRPAAPVTLADGGKSLSPYPVAYDDGPARRDLGWAPAYTIESAVREHIRTVSDRSVRN